MGEANKNLSNTGGKGLNASYDVLDPKKIHFGKSYGEWVTDWFNWFLSADADKRNCGPVVFVRSLGLPDLVSEGSEPQNHIDEQNPYSDDPRYPKKYPNNPNIRIGADRLQIVEDQVVLVPIIVSFWIGSEKYADLGYMRDFTVPTIDNGDNPPKDEQLTINGERVKFPNDLEMTDFRILSSVFTAVIPDVEYGRSIKDFLELQEQSGSFPAVVEGYFVMLKFRPQTVFIHSYASGPRDKNGAYFSELLYEVEIIERDSSVPTQRIVTLFQPAKNERVLVRKLHEKTLLGEMKPEKLKKLLGYIKKSNPTLAIADK